MAQFFNEDAFDDVQTDTFKTKSVNSLLAAIHLKPETIYEIFLNGEPYNWACQPWGKNLGEPLVSTKEGSCLFRLLLEITPEFLSNFGSSDSATKRGYLMVELRPTAGKSAFIKIQTNIYQGSGRTNRIENT